MTTITGMPAQRPDDPRGWLTFVGPLPEHYQSFEDSTLEADYRLRRRVSYNEDHRRKRAFGDGIRWYWGKDRTRPGITVIAAYRDGAPAPARVLELDSMRISDGAVAAGQLWLIGSPENRAGEGPQVFICDVDSEEVHRVGSVDAVDISAHCWPIEPEPLDHDSYVRYCLRRLEGLHFSDSVSNVHARYVGQWPDGRIHLSFMHTRYPDLTLVARLNLYDEQGARLEDIMKYVPARLMEQAGTGAYPPASRAVDGVLYV
jgi:hypothetical protein